MDFKVIWTDSAISDLKDICGYISRDNPAASEFYEKLGFQKTTGDKVSHVLLLTVVTKGGIPAPDQ